MKATLTADDHKAIQDALYRLTHCRGYSEGHGWHWVDERVIAILDQLGVDYRKTDIFDDVPNSITEVTR